MKILSIETSCDETACAVVENGHTVLANVIASQIDLHAKTGGVVPEVAAREHVLKIIPVLEEGLAKSACTWDDIDAIAVTKGPGLISSLIIGTEAANVISYVKNKPLIPVQHIVGHIYSNWLEIDDEIEFPVLILTVSGGHNELVLMRDHFEFEVLGETRDDASGEAFDKVARILGMGYPGGPLISKAAEDGDKNSFRLPRAYLEKDSFDFSFSGLKTAVLNKAKAYAKENGIEDAKDFDPQFRADLSASFQEAVVEVLAKKMFMAVEKYPEIREIHLAGGVSANSRLREIISELNQKNLKFRFPKQISYCTDNAAMIGAAAYYLLQKNPNKYQSKRNIIPSTSFEF
ncbi:tRNA (adenosine(37)-N6)-threonylcarbamoyltransferase complex transferase subunit TsaD [Patescibacteria group bacterium]